MDAIKININLARENKDKYSIAKYLALAHKRCLFFLVSFIYTYVSSPARCEREHK